MKDSEYRKTHFYMNNGGEICGIVKDRKGAVANIVFGFQDGGLRGQALLDAALTGWKYTGQYKPKEHCNLSLEEMAAKWENDEYTLQVADIDTEGVIALYEPTLKTSYGLIFGRDLDDNRSEAK